MKLISTKIEKPPMERPSTYKPQSLTNAEQMQSFTSHSCLYLHVPVVSLKFGLVQPMMRNVDEFNAMINKMSEYRS
jgi:hypothetical protein